MQVIQVRPASLAEWEKEIGIAVLGHFCRGEFAQIHAWLERDFHDSSDHRLRLVDD